MSFFTRSNIGCHQILISETHKKIISKKLFVPFYDFLKSAFNPSVTEELKISQFGTPRPL